MGTDCVFCDIIAGTSPATIVREWDDAIAILPRKDKRGRRGCTEGHILVIPRRHVWDFTENEDVTAAVMRRAARLARELGGQWNLITSAGEDATQTVFHLHVHLVPRRPKDRLKLPWTEKNGVKKWLSKLSWLVSRSRKGRKCSSPAHLTKTRSGRGVLRRWRN